MVIICDDRVRACISQNGRDRENCCRICRFPWIHLSKRRAKEGFKSICWWEWRIRFTTNRVWQILMLCSAAIRFDKKRLAEKTSIAMIVSPLIALMKDQSSSFTERGIVSGYVSDKGSTDKETKWKIIKGECQLNYVYKPGGIVFVHWVEEDAFKRSL